MWGFFLGKHAAGTNVSRKSLRWDWRLEANLNRKANGLALEGPSVGLYVPLLEFNHYPPGTPKWNKIEHRLFCHITQTWRGCPSSIAWPWSS
jgi:hypothetical protein